MSRANSTESVTIHAAKDMVGAIDALATATDRSRDDLVNEALEQFLEANARQVERIKAGHRRCPPRAGTTGRRRIRCDRSQAWLEPVTRLVFAEPAEQDLDDIRRKR